MSLELGITTRVAEGNEPELDVRTSICLICQEKTSDLLDIKPCGHKSFCKLCLQTYMHHQVQLRLHSAGICCPMKRPPDDICREKMTDEFVFSIMEKKEDIEKYKKWQRLSAEPLSQVTSIEPELMEDGILKEAITNSKPCPKCHTLIEKKSGCDHLRCPLCGTDFCFKCGEPCVSGKYVRKCGKCDLGYIDHKHIPQIRQYLFFSWCLWLPVAILYVALCLFCIPLHCCVASIEVQDSAIAQQSAASAVTEKSPQDTEIFPNVAEPSVGSRRGDGHCQRKIKLVLQILLLPFIAVCQFSGLHSCICLMDPQMMEEYGDSQGLETKSTVPV